MQSDPRGMLLDVSDQVRQFAGSPSILIVTPLGYLNHLYGYGDQSPLNRMDPTGEAVPIVIVAWTTATGAVAQGLTTAMRGGSLEEVGSAVAGGAMLGFGIGVGTITGTLSGAALGGLFGIVGDAMTAADALGSEGDGLDRSCE